MGAWSEPNIILFAVPGCWFPFGKPGIHFCPGLSQYSTGSSEGRTNRDTFYKSSCFLRSPSSARPGSHLAEGQCVRGDGMGNKREREERRRRGREIIIIGKKSTAFPGALWRVRSVSSLFQCGILEALERAWGPTQGKNRQQFCWLL